MNNTVVEDRMVRQRLLAISSALFRDDPGPSAVTRVIAALSARPEYAALSERGRRILKPQVGKQARQQRGYRNMPRLSPGPAVPELTSFTPGVVDRDADVGLFWITGGGPGPIIIRLASPLHLAELQPDDSVAYGGPSHDTAWQRLRGMDAAERQRRAIPVLVDTHAASDWPRGSVTYRPVSGRPYFILTAAPEILDRPGLRDLVLRRFGLRENDVEAVRDPGLSGLHLP